MNTVSVRVSYRPIKIAWCVAEGSLDDFRKAIRLSTTLWGGKFNPIISVGGDLNKADTVLRTFRVDALLGPGDTPEVSKFVERSDRLLPWLDLRRDLFIQGAGGPLPVLLDVYHPMQKLSEERERLKRPSTFDGGYSLPLLLTRLKDGSDPMADPLLATLGDYPERDYCPINYGGFADRLLGTDYLELKSELLSEYGERLSPIAITEKGLLVYKPRGGWNTPGVFVGDPTSFSDLVAFWNLRAAGVEVLFFPQRGDDRLMVATRDWAAKVKGVLLTSQPGFTGLPALWCTRETDCKLYEQIFQGGCALHRLSDASWNGLNIKPPRVHFEEQSVLGTVDEGDGRIAVSFPLPSKPFLEGAETQYQHAIVSTRLSVDPNPTVGTFHLPYIPQLNEFYGRNVHFDYARARIEPDALGIVIQLRESDLRLRGVPALQLFTQLFRIAGINAKQSTAGKVALRLIQHMGGLDDCRVFKIGGVRDLLREFSVSKSFSHKQALARIGPGFGPHRGLFIEPREARDLQPQDVFLHLVKKKVIRPGLELECPNCLLPEWHSLNDLGEQVACAFCGTQIESGPQLRDGVWQYHVSGLFARTRDHEGAIPVTLALMQALRCLGPRGMTWVTGMDMSWSDSGKSLEGESDLVVLTRNYEAEPEFLLGECKTNMEINEDQIKRLIAAAERLSDSGIKTFIMFAKAGGPFSDRELELIDAHQTIDLNFILLTPAELEPYAPYENLKSDKIRMAAPRTLSEWAKYSSCLYLKTPPDKVLRRHLDTDKMSG